MYNELISGSILATGSASCPRRNSPGSRFILPALLLFLLSSVSPSPNLAGDNPQTKPLFLVARPSILDPFFAESVVLMIPVRGDPLVVGLIINKPTRLPLSKVFPKIDALKNRSELVYMGGPVEMSTPALVFRDAKIPKQAIPLYDDVYLSFDAKLITKRLEESKPGGDYRLFLGRAQWAPAQLDGEALNGSWYSLHAEGSLIFDRDSEHLWKRLHERARPSTSVEFRVPPLRREQSSGDVPRPSWPCPSMGRMPMLRRRPMAVSAMAQDVEAALCRHQRGTRYASSWRDNAPATAENGGVNPPLRPVTSLVPRPSWPCPSMGRMPMIRRRPMAVSAMVWDVEAALCRHQRGTRYASSWRDNAPATAENGGVNPPLLPVPSDVARTTAILAVSEHGQDAHDTFAVPPSRDKCRAV